jgi:hypothetical protein
MKPMKIDFIKIANANGVAGNDAMAKFIRKMEKEGPYAEASPDCIDEFDAIFDEAYEEKCQN